MSDIYAVVIKGKVVNTIIWNGEGDLDIEGELVHVTDRAAIGWTYDGKEFIPPPVPEKTHEEHVAFAEMEKQGQISAAEQSISIIQTKLFMGRKLTEAETAKVNAVLDYIDAINAIDISKAPDIEWPPAPQ